MTKGLCTALVASVLAALALGAPCLGGGFGFLPVGAASESDGSDAFGQAELSPYWPWKLSRWEALIVQEAGRRELA